jgi:uncharacterized membrane protein YeaQ/YmgE (transglycosylase-associated protein family)
MEDHQIGWIAAIIVGGVAGWLAEQFMKSQMGLLMNVVLGIIGAAVASWLLGQAIEGRQQRPSVRPVLAISAHQTTKS